MKIDVGDDILELTDDVVADLSTYQKYGYNMIRMIRTGLIDDLLIKCKCRPMCHSHWLTTENQY